MTTVAPISRANVPKVAVNSRYNTNCLLTKVSFVSLPFKEDGDQHRLFRGGEERGAAAGGAAGGGAGAGGAGALDEPAATECGQRVGQNGRCVTCHKGTYQITNNYSGRCQGTCTKCDEESGSFTIKECTEENNAECQCRSGFVPSDSDYSTCRCDIGFGLSINNGRKECSKCEHGYFNARINSPCRKWKECKSVRTPGTTKSDVICNNTYATTQPTPTKTISIIKLLTSHRPQEGTENQKIHSTTTTTTATTTKSSSASGHPATPNDKVQPSYPSTTGNYIGMALPHIWNCWAACTDRCDLQAAHYSLP
ncbi:Tumor necrosis factor receptor superfamily member 9 [Larimichthys crocea]|uniref:Uncharacterized protein n=1 Tax=Larimichthys crocea TaxID=215358 RepID=A0ACD3RH92_LARCR|nr:Tumor necrosis factor receptor superfamily member 9 [Larimichthys crocea]